MKRVVSCRSPRRLFVMFSSRSRGRSLVPQWWRSGVAGVQEILLFPDRFLSSCPAATVLVLRARPSTSAGFPATEPGGVLRKPLAKCLTPVAVDMRSRTTPIRVFAMTRDRFNNTAPKYMQSHLYVSEYAISAQCSRRNRERSEIADMLPDAGSLLVGHCTVSRVFFTVHVLLYTRSRTSGAGFRKSITSKCRTRRI
jgi:hypothetical protein